MKKEADSPKNYISDLYQLITGYFRSGHPDLKSVFPDQFIENLNSS